MKSTQKASLLLLLCTLLNTVSCDAGTEPSTDTDSSSTQTTASTVSEQTVETDTADDLPELDFGGKTLAILANKSASYKGYIVTFEETGDVLNDAVHHATRAVEDRLNILFTQEIDTEDIGGNLIMAGDHVYDLISRNDRQAFAYAHQGMMIPYEDMPYIDLDKEYWVNGINDTIRMNNTYYLAYGDFSLSVYDYTYVLAFNKDLMEDLGLDEPYSLVESGKWTFDAFREMMLTANRDLDGNSVMDDADQFGWSSLPKQIPPSMWIAAGCKSITKNENDLPEFTMASDERFAEAYSKILGIAYTSECWHKNDVNTSNYDLPMFQEGRALFQTTSFGQLDNDYYRSMENDYGVLPHPKLNEAQDQYYSRVEGGRLFVIPVTLQDYELVGAGLEALASQAHTDVIPAYFEIALKTKYTRDDESAKMFDLIMASRVYDLGDTIWSSKIRDGFMRTLFIAGSEDLASTIAKNKASIESELQKAIDGFLGQ